MKARIKQIGQGLYRVEVEKTWKFLCFRITQWKPVRCDVTEDSSVRLFYSLDDAKRAADNIRTRPDTFIPKIIDY